ncbi:MAG: hypothetical protein FJY92_11955, partial [Candidatus Hydrogenedentes bacterium]|nr:hypothetical protein [Candidatus Hydrogenedentota bacterium]
MRTRLPGMEAWMAAVGGGHLFFGVYCIFAAVFFRERVIYDTAVFLNTGPLLDAAPFRALDRVSVQLPPQLLPLAVVLLGGPSMLAALAYSVNFALFHYVVWLALVHGFRRRDLGAGFIVCILVNLVHTNTFIQADLIHAAGYLFLFIAAAEWTPRSAMAGRTTRPALLLILLTAACFGHPVMTVLSAHFALYIMLTAKRFDKTLAIITAVVIILYFVNKAAIKPGYESGAFGTALALRHLPESLSVLPNYLRRAHWPAAAFLVVSTAAVLRARSGWLAFGMTLGTLGTLLTALCSWIPLYEHSNWQFSGYTWMYFLSLYIVMVLPVYHRNAETGRGGVRTLAAMRTLAFVIALTWAIAGTTLDFHLAREREMFITRVRDALDGVAPRTYLLDAQFSTNPLLRENDLTMWDD